MVGQAKFWQLKKQCDWADGWLYKTLRVWKYSSWCDLNRGLKTTKFMFLETNQDPPWPALTTLGLLIFTLQLMFAKWSIRNPQNLHVWSLGKRWLKCLTSWAGALPAGSYLMTLPIMSLSGWPAPSRKSTTFRGVGNSLLYFIYLTESTVKWQWRSTRCNFDMFGKRITLFHELAQRWLLISARNQVLSHYATSSWSSSMISQHSKHWTEQSVSLNATGHGVLWSDALAGPIMRNNIIVKALS